MKVAVYGKKFEENFKPHIQFFLDQAFAYGWKVLIFEPFLSFLEPRIQFKQEVTSYKSSQELQDIDLIFSVGGDGTFLDTVSQIGTKKIPIVGLNTGRLGFLANINKDDFENCLELINKGAYKIQKRSLIQLESSEPLFKEKNFALNEVTVHKKDSSSMITIHTYLDGDYLNSYWADGLIVSTPTGSTAYSLSCGGPILLPSSKNFIITPIAPHNLNVRPVVVPDDIEIQLKIEGRGRKFLAALDSKSASFDTSLTLTIKKSNFQINLVELEGQSFFDTLRKKMLWGIDRRN